MQIGNAWIDNNTGDEGIYDFLWAHAMISDETIAGLHKYCDFVTGKYSKTCYKYQSKSEAEAGNIDIYNIYAPLCHITTPKLSSSIGSVSHFSLKSKKQHAKSYITLLNLSMLNYLIIRSMILTRARTITSAHI